jgi:hypothetical protein
MKTSTLLLILFSINLVACLGDKAPDLPSSNSNNLDLDICSNEAPNVTNLVDYQIVYDECIQWDEYSGNVVIKYKADKAELTGIGFRIHYDNLSMKFLSVSDVFSKDLIYAPENSINDTENSDQDTSTNTYLNAAWASVYGNWPGKTDQDLMTLKFEKISDGAENYNLMYSKISAPPGYIFNPETNLETESDTGTDTNPNPSSDIETNPSSEADSVTGTSSNSGASSIESSVTIPELAAATQHVYVSESTKSEDGSQETVVVTYNADAGNTGLGLRIHFDSNAVSVYSIGNILAMDTILANSTPTADTSDFDGDASTDSYIDMAWASLLGGWPGTTPTNLANVTFDIVEDATGSTAINFSASSTAAGFAFALQNHSLTLSAENLD